MSDINRFIEASNEDYPTALREIKNGRKSSHWIWYIFPQIEGLGYSSMATYYAIKDEEEAKEFLNHDVLGPRLNEITQELLNLNSDNLEYVLGDIDYLKVKSSMTLFDYISEEDNIFNEVINKYYNGVKDKNTLNILGDKNTLKKK